MADDDLGDFESVDAGASLTTPAQASALRKGGFMCIKNRPCKIVEMSTSKTGKHGHAKIHFVALDIFTNKKYEDIVPSTHNCDVPSVKRTEYLLCDIEDDFLHLMDDSGTMREDIALPTGDIGNDIKTKHAKEDNVTVTVQKSMGEETVVQVKIGTK